MTAAVLGSLVLTATASSAPLANAWSGIDQSLIGIGQTLQRFFPAGGPGTRITGYRVRPVVGDHRPLGHRLDGGAVDRGAAG